MNREIIEAQLAELPLYQYAFLTPDQLTFTDRVRWICEHECPMYGKTWACPPAVGSVEECRARCMAYDGILLIATITEVSDIANIEETLATRAPHEEITRQVHQMLRAEAQDTMVLSTEACAICETCAWAEGKPCRHPDKMHPCVESHGINIIPTLEELGLSFQYGDNVVTWVSLLFF